MSNTKRYIALYNSLCKDIMTGVIRIGDKLPSDLEMSKKLGVSPSTVTRAMCLLEAKGILKRTPKVGTVVVSAPTKRSRGVIVMADSTGHFNEKFAQALTENLLKSNLYPIWIAPSLFRDSISAPRNSVLMQFLQQVLTDFPYGFIINGDNLLPFNFFKQHEKDMGKIVFVCNYMSDIAINASYCIIDSYATGRKIAEYFAGQNFTRMAYLSCHIPRYGFSYNKGPHELIVSGMHDYCAQNGLYFDRITTDRLLDGGSLVEILSELKTSGRLPQAVATHSDSFCARELYPVCAALNIKIPDDISVLGYFDTPWCIQLAPELSSVYLDPVYLAAESVKLLLDPEQQTSFTTARIIERGSIALSNKEVNTSQ